MNALLTVLIKELRESLRDRRTLLNALLIGPLLGPVLFVVIMKVSITRQLEHADQPLPVVVIGARYAPNLIAALEQAGMQSQPALAAPEAAVRAQQAELVLRIAADYADAWRNGKAAQVELIYDSSRADTGAAVQRLRYLLSRYAQQQAGLRLVARGLSPTLLAPVMIAERDQATPQARGAMLFSIVPYFLIFTALMGGMFLAIDATAGERERQSLEPLLINPVPRSHILLGKLIAICVFSLCSVLLSLAAFTLAGFILARGVAPLPVALNLDFALHLVPLLLPVIGFAASLQMLVTVFAKSFREAQTWLGLLQLLPAIPLMMVTVLQVKPMLWMYALPLLGQEVAALQLLRGVAIAPIEAAINVLGTVLATGLVWWMVQRIYQSERMAITG